MLIGLCWTVWNLIVFRRWKNLGLREFSEEEVLNTIKSMNCDKSPGPDGFSIAFYQRCWDSIKMDLMLVMEEFYYSEEFYDHLNNTFITLIPRKKAAKEFKNFRPISLLSSVIVKMLSMRLMKVLKNIISPPQVAFIEGHQILDGVLIANECIEDRHLLGRSGVICKLDLEKAYDHVNWRFMDYLLLRMGFGVKWRSWISFCVSSVSFSILINSCPAGFFSRTRGLKQGDLLSPFLFIIVSEVLNRMIRKTKMGFISGFHVGDGDVTISNLQFADDTMVFCDADVRQLGYLRCILRCFELVLGLTINLDKSEIFQVGENCDIENMTWIMGYKIRSIPVTYLGFPLGANYKSKRIWEPVIDRISSRLDSSKSLLLSKGGRLTQVKATLVSMPNYFLSLFTIPSLVANKMEALFRNFLWNDSAEHHKYHLVDWKSCCKPMEYWGLGIRKL